MFFLIDFEQPSSLEIVHQLNHDFSVGNIATDSAKFIATERFGSRIKSFEINEAPKVQNMTISVDEDNFISDEVPVIDRENDSISLEIIEDSVNGVVELGTEGVFTYTPNTNFNGTDEFTFIAEDSLGGQSEVSTVFITVNSINDAPVIESSTFIVDEDTQLNESVIASDVDGDSLTFALESSTENGTVELTSEGSFVYSPSENFNGTDSFQVIASDGLLNSLVKTIDITINPINDTPVVTVNDLVLSEDTTAGDSATFVDVDGDSVTFSLAGTAENGTATVNSDGSYTYQPDENYNGSDSFAIMATDGVVNSVAVTVNVTVEAVNDAPDASSSSISTSANTNVSGSLSSTDIDGDSLTYSLENNASNGSVTVDSSGGFTYSPNDGYSGSDSFIFKVTDTSGASDTATVSISVSAPPSSGGVVIWLLPIMLLLRMRKSHF